MARTIPIADLTRGIQNENPQPGTLREVMNLLPWRGALRRRGPVKSHQTHTEGLGTNLSFIEAIHNPNLKLGSKTAYAVPYTSGSSYTQLRGDGYSTPIYGGLSRISRMITNGTEVLLLPYVDASTTGTVWRWAGAPENTTAFSGNITMTAGSRHVVFASAVAVGVAAVGYISRGGNYYAVEKALSSTTLLLKEPARTTYTGSAWDAFPLATLQCSNAPAGGGLFNDYNNGAGGGSLGNFVTAGAGCFHQGRLFVGNIWDGEWSGTAGSTVYQPSAYRWSALYGDDNDANNYSAMQNFNGDAIEFLDDEGGPILGMVSLNGALVFIRRQSVQVMTGTMNSDGSPSDASVNTIGRNIGAGGFSAWDSFEGGVAFADEKGVYVWDGSSVTNLTRGVIERAYRNMVGTNADKLVVQTPGNRIMVHTHSAPSGDSGFVFDFNVGGWFRIQLAGPMSRMCDTGSKYLALRNERFSLGGGAYEFRSYDARPVFEDLDTDSAGMALDADNGSQTLDCYLLTNPVPLGDGWNQGRVTSVSLMDGGCTAVDGDVNYTVSLLRGAIYSADGYSGDAAVASQLLTDYHQVPAIIGSSANQRVVNVRLNGAVDAAHAMVQVQHGAASSDKTFAFGISGIGLVVDENPGYQSA